MSEAVVGPKAAQGPSFAHPLGMRYSLLPPTRAPKKTLTDTLADIVAYRASSVNTLCFYKKNPGCRVLETRPSGALPIDP